MAKHLGYPRRQAGVALLMALMFLVIITLIALSTMRSSTLELKMAGNEQFRTQAVQSAQTAIDEVTAINNFPVITDGFTVCFNKTANADGNPCDRQATDLSASTYANNQVEIKLMAVGAFTCRACQTSANKFDAAQFSMLSDYQNSATGSRAQINQGMLMMVPAGGSN
jgi:Tfp pilus assembly protein PilX